MLSTEATTKSFRPKAEAPFQVGVGLRTSFQSELIQRCTDRPVDFIEIISESYFHSRALQRIQPLIETFPISCHGVAMGLGNENPPSREYLNLMQLLIRGTQPRVVSDHLCWTGVPGHTSHDLLPLPYTQESLQRMSEHIDEVQSILKREIAIENPSSYLSYTIDEMTESEFLAELVRKTGCQLLVDVNNIFVSAFNHSFDALAYIDDLKGLKIAQYHIAGHTHKGTHLLDTHIGPVPSAVKSLLKVAIRSLGSAPVLLEWDEQIPELDVLLSELNDIRASVDYASI